MSDWEYFCPRCEEKIAKWNFEAPADFYRCWQCGLATPFIQLPRRNVLRTWASVRLQSIRIPRGTGGGSTDTPTTTATISGVQCGVGSILVVGFMTNDDLFPVTTVSVTWGSDSLTTAQFHKPASVGSGIAYLVTASGGTKDVVATMDSSGEITAFATEITLPKTASPLDGSVSGDGGSRPISLLVPSGSGSDRMVISVGGQTPLSGWQSPMADGQVLNPGSAFPVAEGFGVIGSSSKTVTADSAFIASWVSSAAAFAITV